MGKYNVELDMESNNSASLILNMIQPGSTVLEFGCAEGRMTRYMKEVLECMVYIVEIDAEAFGCARRYAADGCCCDIESYDWVEMVYNASIDYVIFADVLEHLRDPQMLVSRIYTLMRPAGQLIISVPNIAHSAVLLSLLNNRFSYQSEGLLDNTHIHFFTHDSLEEMLEKTNFFPVERKATHILAWNTELKDDFSQFPQSLQKEISDKDYGSCYQFVYRCKKAEYLEKRQDKELITNSIQKNLLYETLKLYVAENDVFSEDRAITVLIGMGENEVALDISAYNDISLMRLDITEDRSIIRLFDIAIDDVPVNIKSLWGNYSISVDNVFVFLKEDPYFHIVTETSPKKIVIRFSVERALNQPESELAYKLIAERIQRTRQQADSSGEIINALKDTIVVLNTSMQQRNDQLSDMQQEIAGIRQTLMEKDRETLELLAIREERALRLMEQEHQIFELQEKSQLELENLKSKSLDEKRQLEEKFQYMAHKYSLMETNYLAISNSQFWRLTKPLRMALDLIRAVKNLILHLSCRKKQDFHFPYSVDMIEFAENKLTVKGWAFVPGGVLKNLQIILRIGQEEYPLQTISGLQRDDVYNIFQVNAARHSGFSCYAQIENSPVFNVYLTVELDGIQHKIFLHRFSNGISTRVQYYKGRLNQEALRKIWVLLKNRELDQLSRVALSPVIRSIDVDLPSVDFFLWATDHARTQMFIPHQVYDYTVDVIVPVYNGYEYLKKLFTTIPKTKMQYNLYIVNDKSPDSRVLPYLKEIAAADIRVTLLENEENLGFVRSVCKAIEHTRNHVALLNSDIELPEFWMERLMQPIILEKNVASATPFTNCGTICSFPVMGIDNKLVDGRTVDEIDRVFQTIKPLYHKMPTGVGFCMGMNREVLQKIGAFDIQSFSMGYGEENDWCQRAEKAGYRNVMAENLFVYHKHGGSFLSDQKRKLMEKNSRVLAQKHPSYDHDVAKYFECNPASAFRDYAFMLLVAQSNPVSLYLDHNIGGGATAYLEQKIRDSSAQGNAAVVVRYDVLNQAYFFVFTYKNYHCRYRLKSFGDIEQLIGLIHIQAVHVNELVTYPHLYSSLRYLQQWKQEHNFQLILYLHDYYAICPTVNLCNKSKQFCNLPEVQVCESCLKENNTVKNYEFEKMSVWRQEWGAFLNDCDHIYVFSNDSKNLLKQAYGALQQVTVQPHEVNFFPSITKRRKTTATLNIGLIGALNTHKGLPVIEKMLDAIDQQRNRDIRIILIGEALENIDSPYFSQSGRYHQESLPYLALEQDIDLFFISSIIPETFSYSTEEAIKMGYPVVCFDLGAPAERVRNYERGLVLNSMDPQAALLELVDFADQKILPAYSEPSTTRVLFVSDYISFSSRYRVDHYQEQLYLQGQGSDFCMAQELKPSVVESYDVFILYRCRLTVSLHKFINAAHSQFKKVYYDIDDYVFDYEQILYLGFLKDPKYKNFEKSSRDILACMKLCDGFSTSTNTLCGAIQEKFPEKPVVTLRNVASMEMVILSQEAHAMRQTWDQSVVLGYFSGSGTHDNDFPVIEDTIISLFHKFPNLYLTVGGLLQLSENMKNYENRIIRLEFVDWRQLPNHVASVDINLMPIEDTFFHCCKSENKWMEAALAHVPTVASHNEELAWAIRDGETGFLCRDSSQWQSALEHLIADSALRSRIADNAYSYVLENNTTARNNSPQGFLITPYLYGHYADESDK